MEIIEQLTFNALARRRAITLPGFGTLSVNEGEASIDPRTNELVPPRHTLAFAMTFEAETVVDQMIDGASLPPSDADSIYKRWLAALKKGEAGGGWSIDGVCRIEPAGESYRVTAAPALDRILNPFDVQRIPLVVQKAAPAPRKEKKKSEKTVKQQASAPKARPEKQPRAGRQKWGWIILIVASVILLGIGCWMYFSPENLIHLFRPFPKQEAVIVPAVPEAPVVPVPAARDTLAADSAAVVDVALQSRTQSPAADIPADVTRYHVVIGVFSTEENSRRFMEESGFASAGCRVIPTSKGLFMASVGTYLSEEEAETQLRKVAGAHPGAWVFKQPPSRN